MPSAMTPLKSPRRSSGPAPGFLSCMGAGFLSERNDARIPGRCAVFHVGPAGRACTRASRRHHERQLQHHGSRKRVQTGIAGALACAEVQVPARDGETRGSSEVEDRDPAERCRSAVCFRPADGADLPEFADSVGLRPRRCARPSRTGRHAAPIRRASMGRPPEMPATTWAAASISDALHLLLEKWSVI